MNRRQIIADVYKKFIVSFYDYVEDMRHCQQGEHLLNPSPYHLEGDVWTHTNCCYTHVNDSFNLCYDDGTEHQLKMICLAVLFHDIGKPDSLVEKDDGKRAFNGHDTKSMQIMMDHHELICRYFAISQEDLVKLMLVVQVHTLYYQLKTEHDIFKYLNYDHGILRLYCALATCDYKGQIRGYFGDDDNDNKSFISHLLLRKTVLPQPVNYDNDRQLVIFNGCPASGKDYIANDSRYVEQVISWDDVMVDLYSKENPDETDVDYPELYRQAFKWCRESKINMLQEVKAVVKAAYESGKTCIGITTAKQTRKTRKCLFGIARENKATPHCIYVMNHLETLIERDLNRMADTKGKLVGDRNIATMYFNQVLPTKKEGFSTITYVFN